MTKLLLILMMVGALSGCSGDDKPTGPSTEEIEAYIEKISALAAKESAILADYASVQGENYTNDATMLEMVISLVPRSNAFISKIEAITPPRSLRETHEKYIRLWNLHSEAFITIRAALENNDVSLVSEANEKLAEARRLQREYLAEIEEASQ